MGPGDDSYKILYDVQRKCNELNRKIDSIIRIMEMFTAYMQYSSMMADFQDSQPEGSESMNPNDFQKLMNAAKQNNAQMSEGEFNQLFESLKQGKSAEEAARMDQMLQLAKSFMK